MVSNQKNINNVKWKELYGKNQKPPETALNDFWPNEIRELLAKLSNALSDKYGFALTNLTYTVTYGWKFKYSFSSVGFIANVFILDDGFVVDNIAVRDSAGYHDALSYVSSLYTDDFINKCNEKIFKRNKEQIERSKRRIEREEKETKAFLNAVDPEKLNKFVWSPKISQGKIKKLYATDAKHIRDEELVDEVGFMIYARCLQGRDERQFAKSNKLKCHYCGEINKKPSNGLIVCPCGYAYIFREYMRDMNKKRMPSWSFHYDFINKWEVARTYSDKMMVIDFLIHECHKNMFSGVNRNSAGINLIHGTNKQVNELILSLAYK